MTVAPPMHKVYNYRMNKELEYTKMKVGSLISLRQSLMAVLTVLVGGVVGLSFMQNSSVKTLYVILGWYFIIILLRSLYSTDKKLDMHLHFNKKELK